MYTCEKINIRITVSLIIIGVFFTGLVGLSTEAQKREEKKSETIPTIAFISSRFDPALMPPAWLLSAEIYLMNGDGTNVRRITNNTTGENFPAISPDGKRIVFESNRLRKKSDPDNWVSLFVMNVDGSGEVSLVPGNSATWSRDSKNIAFHASASGKGKPITGLPGAASNDSDIFILNVDDFLSKKSPARNITNNPDAVDDDPDWSPDGKKILFTSHSVTDDQTNSATAEIYIIDANGKGKPKRLTNNTEEERAPDWSPDGKLIVYSCRKGDVVEGRLFGTFELCVMNADGSGQKRITNNRVAELTASWSPDGKQIFFHRAVGGLFSQLFTINADGTGERQLTFTPGFNGFASWGEVRTSAKTSSLISSSSEEQNKNQNGRIEQELIQLANRWNEAFLKNDTATLRTVMAEDIIIIYGDGSRATREEEIASIGKNEQIESSIADEIQVKVYGDTAVMMSRLTVIGVRHGKKFNAQFRFLDVYRKRDGRWQCVITQNTRIGKLDLSALLN